MDYIPKVSTLIDKANIPNTPSKPFTELDKEQIYENIINYYDEYADIQPAKYRLESDSFSEEIPTTAYIPKGFSYDGFKDLGVSYTNYSYEALERAGLNTTEIWNGDSSICVFEDDKFKIGKTDYYTSTIFSRLLYIESANALMQKDGDTNKVQRNDFPLRNSMLSDKDDLFDTPAFSTGMSSGGLLIAKHNGEWKMLFAKRSMKPRVNQGMTSVVPNGGVEYSDFTQGKPPKQCLKREFSEELFTTLGDGMAFFDENIESHKTSVAWNLRSGNVSFGHVMYTNEEGFKQIVSEDKSNFEFSELIQVPIMDIERICELMEPGNFSPSVVPLVMNSLEHFDEKDETPNLPYYIERSNN